MNTQKLGRKKCFSSKQGSALFVAMALMIFILPTLLIFVRTGKVQNRNAIKDRNLKTAREMAESVNVDFMNTFSDDWHRDYFDSIYLGADVSTFSGLGNAAFNLGVFRASSTINISTLATYNKGTSGYALTETKRLETSYFWSSDALKFDYVFPGDSTIGGNIDRELFRRVPGAVTAATTFYVNGNFDSGTTAMPAIPAGNALRGFWVVNGDFTLRAPVRIDSGTRIHCRNFITVGFPTTSGSIVRQFPDRSLIVPNVKVIGPEGASPSMSLTRYDVYRSTGFVITPGNALSLRLGVSDFTLEDLDSTLTPIPATVRTLAYTSTFSTNPWTLTATGGDVYLIGGVINRPSTVVALTGNIHITGDLVYNNAPINRAAPNQSLAALAAGDVILDSDAGGTQNISGFFGTPTGKIVVQGIPRVINVNGTFYGPVSSYAILSSDHSTFLQVVADPGLSQFPPPLFPRRPRLLGWKYAM